MSFLIKTLVEAFLVLWIQGATMKAAEEIEEGHSSLVEDVMNDFIVFPNYEEVFRTLSAKELMKFEFHLISRLINMYRYHFNFSDTEVKQLEEAKCLMSKFPSSKNQTKIYVHDFDIVTKFYPCEIKSLNEFKKLLRDAILAFVSAAEKPYCDAEFTLYRNSLYCVWPSEHGKFVTDINVNCIYNLLINLIFTFSPSPIELSLKKLLSLNDSNVEYDDGRCDCFSTNTMTHIFNATIQNLCHDKDYYNSCLCVKLAPWPGFFHSTSERRHLQIKKVKRDLGEYNVIDSLSDKFINPILERTFTEFHATSTEYIGVIYGTRVILPIKKVVSIEISRLRAIGHEYHISWSILKHSGLSKRRDIVAFDGSKYMAKSKEFDVNDRGELIIPVVNETHSLFEFYQGIEDLNGQNRRYMRIYRLTVIMEESNCHVKEIVGKLGEVVPLKCSVAFFTWPLQIITRPKINLDYPIQTLDIVYSDGIIKRATPTNLSTEMKNVSCLYTICHSSREMPSYPFHFVQTISTTIQLHHRDHDARVFCRIGHKNLRLPIDINNNMDTTITGCSFPVTVLFGAFKRPGMQNVYYVEYNGKVTIKCPWLCSPRCIYVFVDEKGNNIYTGINESLTLQHVKQQKNISCSVDAENYDNPAQLYLRLLKIETNWDVTDVINLLLLVFICVTLLFISVLCCIEVQMNAKHKQLKKLQCSLERTDAEKLHQQPTDDDGTANEVLEENIDLESDQTERHLKQCPLRGPIYTRLTVATAECDNENSETSKRKLLRRDDHGEMDEKTSRNASQNDISSMGEKEPLVKRLKSSHDDDKCGLNNDIDEVIYVRPTEIVAVVSDDDTSYSIANRKFDFVVTDNVHEEDTTSKRADASECSATFSQLHDTSKKQKTEVKSAKRQIIFDESMDGSLSATVVSRPSYTFETESESIIDSDSTVIEKDFQLLKSENNEDNTSDEKSYQGFENSESSTEKGSTASNVQVNGSVS